jgi:hypothetical protein
MFIIVLEDIFLVDLKLGFLKKENEDLFDFLGLLSEPLQPQLQIAVSPMIWWDSMAL